ncbi:MAG: hypothetical protein LGB05_06880 [Sulfurovum sp.]|nr:hypothetical protein [Sulfurovum sp.]
MLIDFRRAPTVIPDLFIDGVKVERVTEFKYLGTVLDNKLNFKKKYIKKMLLFYALSIESVLTFSFLCWFGGLNVKSKNVLNKVVNVCGKVVGERQEHLSQLYERRVVQKARVVVDDDSHVLIMSFFHLVDNFAYLNQIQSIAFLNR